MVSGHLGPDVRRVNSHCSLGREPTTRIHRSDRPVLTDHEPISSRLKSPLPILLQLM